MSGANPAVFRRSRRQRRVSQFLNTTMRHLLDFMQASWVPLRLRKSLTLRMGLTMLISTLVILSGVGLYTANSIRDGIFQERLNQLLVESASRAKTAQSRLDQAPVSTVEQVQSLAQEVVTSITTMTSGGNAPSVLILRNPNETSAIVINEIVTGNSRETISPELRQSVEKKTGQYWQSVKLTDAEGRTFPGIAVGTALNLPLAGAHELYFVYSLADEQANLNLVMQVLAGGGLALLLLVGAMTWVVVYSVLVPVRRTVRTAERLAAGDLNARVLSQGQDEMAQLADSFNKNPVPCSLKSTLSVSSQDCSNALSPMFPMNFARR